VDQYFGIDLSQELLDMTYEENKLVALMGGMVTMPELLILEHPFYYLSKEMRRKLLELLAKLHDKGITILLATDKYEDVAGYADSYIYIRDGEIIPSDVAAQKATALKMVKVRGERSEIFEQMVGRPVGKIPGGYYYISGLSWQELVDAIKQASINDRDVYVDMAHLDEVLDLMHKPNKD